MLHNFLSSNRDELIRRCIDKVAKRPKRNATEKQLRNGIPIGNTVVFSAHGVSKAVQAEADTRGL